MKFLIYYATENRHRKLFIISKQLQKKISVKKMNLQMVNSKSAEIHVTQKCRNFF